MASSTTRAASCCARAIPALNRITKYIPQLPGSQFKGHTLYLRKRSSQGSQIFSPLFVPTLDPYERYECRVGLGYSHFRTEFHGIKSEISLFVPTAEAILIAEVSITNQGNEPVEIDAVPLLEYTHFDALKQFTNADWVPQTMQSEAHDDGGGRTILSQFAFMNRDQRQTYFTANVPVSSFETDRRMFLGDNEYGTFQRPLSLESQELSNTLALRGDNIAALMLPLGTLAPGETKRFVTLLTPARGQPKREPFAGAGVVRKVSQSRGRGLGARRHERGLGQVPRPRPSEHARRQHEQHAERAQPAAVLHDQELVARSIAVSTGLWRPRHGLPR